MLQPARTIEQQRQSVLEPSHTKESNLCWGGPLSSTVEPPFGYHPWVKKMARNELRSMENAKRK
jgi:hypothetical protein